MLAEAALSRDLLQPKADPRIRLVDSVRKRTANWDTIESYHGSRERRTKATESILNAAILACEDVAEGRKESSDDTQKAFVHLWSLQVTKGALAGAWDWYDYNLAPWEARSEYFGASLAAASVGSAPGYLAGMSATDKQHLEMLRTYLKKKVGVQDLHQRLTAVWASTKLPEMLSEQQRDLIVKDALALQNADGGWSAGGLGVWKRSDGKPQAAASDGYGTALVVAALKQVVKGEELGAIEHGLIWLRRHQRGDDGSWPAGSLNTAYASGDAASLFMRDAATGWAILALKE